MIDLNSDSGLDIGRIHSRQGYETKEMEKIRNIVAITQASLDAVLFDQLWRWHLTAAVYSI